MPKYEAVSPSVVKRMARYYRFVSDLAENGTDRISSQQLAEKMGLTASQIRQDLNCFGGFGQQGYGYNVELLKNEMEKILGLTHSFKTILIGYGNLGKAICAHMNFSKRGFRLCGIFDSNPEIVGTITHLNIPIRHTDTIDEFYATRSPKVAILCIPKTEAFETAQRLVDLGIKSFWNFTHIDIGLLFPDIIVENVHLSDSLMSLCFQTNRLFKHK